jgi:Ankyrin repeats (3 copies)/Ankyrin repeat
MTIVDGVSRTPDYILAPVHKWQSMDVRGLHALHWDLLQAIMIGNLTDVEAVLRRGADPNFPRSYYNITDIPALHAVVFRCNCPHAEDKLQLLVEAQCDVNILDYGQQRTALSHASAIAWKASVVKKLLELRADPNILDPDGETALYHAAAYGGREAVSLLLAYGAEVNPAGLSPLGGAACRGTNDWPTGDSTVIATMLLQNGARPDAMLFNKTPLHHAVEQNDVQMVDVLLTYNADYSTPDARHGLTPQQVADADPQLAVVATFLRRRIVGIVEEQRARELELMMSQLHASASEEASISDIGEDVMQEHIVPLLRRA